MNKVYGIKVTAPFLMGGKWSWRTFTFAGGNKHEAIIQHGKSIGAQGWDFGQADVSEVVRIVA
jgi:hypothetical protein